uniref:PglL family O-oligosaccharyltransferase n=1 Tax=Thaumasiovibrio occultus TaxID=1891184 RepID=UPI000B358547|nr:PglL family O-oligosaccharyltransferase [Thaumasiovibrio occultus]
METSQPKIKRPLTRWFLGGMGFIFFVAMNMFLHNHGGAGLSIPYNQMVWAGIAFVISVGIVEACRQGTWRYSNLTLLLFGCCVLLTIPLFYPHSTFEDASSRIGALWAGWLLFSSLQQFKFSLAQRESLLWFILLCAIIQAGLGWVQHLIFEQENPMGYNVASGRPYGMFQQVNVMASFMATGLILSGYLLARKTVYKGRWAWKLIPIILTPVLTIPLILTINSFTGYLGTIIGGLLIVPFLWIFCSKKKLVAWSVSCLLGIAIGMSWVQVETSNREFRTASDIEANARTYIYPQVAKMFLTKPISGYGYGNFGIEYLKETAQWYQNNDFDDPGLLGLTHPHNELLFWSVEGGIVALVGLMLAALFVFQRVLQAKRGTKLSLIGLFFPIVLHTQTEFPFYHSAIPFVVFIIFIFWVDNLTCRYKNYEIEFPLPFKIMGTVFPSFVIIYMVTGFYSAHWMTKFELSMNTDYLKRVINPVVWGDRIEVNTFAYTLMRGANENNTDMLEEYLAWATKSAQRRPWPQLYQNMIAVTFVLGDVAAAEQLWDEAQYLYPRYKFAWPDSEDGTTINIERVAM